MSSTEDLLSQFNGPNNIKLSFNKTDLEDKVEEEDLNKHDEQLYRGITIGIVGFGIFLLIILTCYVIRENRDARRDREARKEQATKEIAGDIPPTYSQVVMRADPPNYDESLMQEINPEGNPSWMKDLESSKVHLEVKERIAKKVGSQAHGLLYAEAMRSLSQEDLVRREVLRAAQADLDPQMRARANSNRERSRRHTQTREERLTALEEIARDFAQGNTQRTMGEQSRANQAQLRANFMANTIAVEVINENSAENSVAQSAAQSNNNSNTSANHLASQSADQLANQSADATADNEVSSADAEQVRFILGADADNAYSETNIPY